MKYFGLISDGQEKDHELFNVIHQALINHGNSVLFASKDACVSVTEEIKKELAEIPGLEYEWLNDWDNSSQPSVVFCVSRSKTMPYAIAYLHFYKVNKEV